MDPRDIICVRRDYFRGIVDDSTYSTIIFLSSNKTHSLQLIQVHVFQGAGYSSPGREDSQR